MTKPMAKPAQDIKEILAQKALDGPTGSWSDMIAKSDRSDVEQALAQQAGLYNLQKLVALVSPAAENYLEQMAQIAHNLTTQRFGKTIQLYAPLYVSNFCTNSCLKICRFLKEGVSRGRS